MNSDRFVIFIDTIGSKKSEYLVLSDRNYDRNIWNSNVFPIGDPKGVILGPIDEAGRSFDEVSTKFRQSFHHGSLSDGPVYDGYGFFLFHRVSK